MGLHACAWPPALVCDTRIQCVTRKSICSPKVEIFVGWGRGEINTGSQAVSVLSALNFTTQPVWVNRRCAQNMCVTETSRQARGRFHYGRQVGPVKDYSVDMTKNICPRKPVKKWNGINVTRGFDCSKVKRPISPPLFAVEHINMFLCGLSTASFGSSKFLMLVRVYRPLLQERLLRILSNPDNLIS